MTDRITNRDLEQCCTILNRAVNGNNEPLWKRMDDGNLHAHIGAYYVNGAYGGVALYRMVTDGGGVTDVSRFGHQPKRRLHDFMRGMLEGIDAIGGQS